MTTTSALTELPSAVGVPNAAERRAWSRWNILNGGNRGFGVANNERLDGKRDTFEGCVGVLI